MPLLSTSAASTGTTVLKYLAAILAYFAPLTSMIHVVLVFIAVDFLTGIYAAYRNKIKIESHKLRKTIEKFVLYTCSIIIGYMFQTEFAGWSNLAQIIAGFIAMTELISVYENITRITGLDILTKIRSLLKDSLKKLYPKK